MKEEGERESTGKEEDFLLTACDDGKMAKALWWRESSGLSKEGTYRQPRSEWENERKSNCKWRKERLWVGRQERNRKSQWQWQLVMGVNCRFGKQWEFYIPSIISAERDTAYVHDQKAMGAPPLV
jgi:hypothetical protein